MLAITQFTGLPSALVVHLYGELDLFSALQLRTMLHRAVTTGRPHITIDLEGVSFVDASALGFLERLWNELRARDAAVDLSLINVSPRLDWLVGLIGLRATFRLTEPAAQPA